MATSYFESFPKLLYSQNNNRDFNIVPDVLRRAVVEKIASLNASYFDQYDVGEGETPETVADKFYDDPTLHWVILHVNEILDPRFEWPLSETQLQEYALAKYGSIDAINEVHHVEGYNITSDENVYEESNFILAPETQSLDEPVRILFEGTRTTSEGRTARIPITHADNVKITNLVTNIEFESRENEKRRRIRILKPELVADVVSTFQTLIKE